MQQDRPPCIGDRIRNPCFPDRIGVVGHKNPTQQWTVYFPEVKQRNVQMSPEECCKNRVGVVAKKDEGGLFGTVLEEIDADGVTWTACVLW